MSGFGSPPSLLSGEFSPARARVKLGLGATAPAVSLTNRLAQRWLSGGSPSAMQSQTGGANTTITTLYHIEAVAGWVRFLFANDQTSSWTITNAAVATSGTYNDGMNPTNAAGSADNTLWQAITFNNAGADADPHNQIVAPVTSGTIGAAGSGGTNGAQVATLAMNAATNVDLATNSSATAVRPSLNVTVSGGAITAVGAVVQAGAGIVYLPPNPAAVSGTGIPTGATLNFITSPVTTITVPGTTTPAQPNVIYSDWIPLDALPPTDGSFGAFIMMRVVNVPGNTRYVPMVGAPDVAIGRKFFGGFQSGNKASSPVGTGAFSSFNMQASQGIEYISSVPGLSVLSVGDSILSSLHSTASASGPVVRACAMASTAACPVGHINAAIPGEQTPHFTAEGRLDIDRFRPNVLVLQTWSENDDIALGGTQSVSDRCFDRAMALADYATRQRMAVILCTAAPVYVGQSGPEVRRVAVNARTRLAAQQRGYFLLDLDVIWGTGASPNAYNPAYDFGDHTHPNDAGCVVAATALAAILTAIGSP